MTTANTVTAGFTVVLSTPALEEVANTYTLVRTRRETDPKKPIPATERYRAINVPAENLAVPSDQCSSKFHQLLQNTILGFAKKKFEVYITDNMGAKEVALNLFTMDAVLAYASERAEASKIDAEKITAWLVSSATFKTLNEKQQVGWKELLPKIAAPGYGNSLLPTPAATIIAKLHADDLEHPVAQFIMQRCNSVILKNEAESAL